MTAIRKALSFIFAARSSAFLFPYTLGTTPQGPRSSSNPRWHLGQETFLVGRAFSNTLVLALSISVHWVL